MALLVAGIRSYYAARSAYFSTVSATNPIAYYPLNTWIPKDVTDTVTPSTCTGGAFGATGIGDGDYSCRFSGSSSGLISASTALLDTLNAFTIEAIVSPAVVNVTQTAAAIENSSTDCALLRVNSSGRAQFVVWDSGGSATTITGTTVMTTDYIYHLSGTWNGSTATLYVNGVSEGTASVQSLQSGANKKFTIGRRSASEYFNGRISGVAFYNVSLAAATVTAHNTAKQPTDRSGLIPGTYKPSDSTTGVPLGTNLTYYAPPGGPGSYLTITTPGTIIEGLDIDGGINIRAANVIIRKNKIRGPISPLDSFSYGAISVQGTSGYNYLVQDNEIYCSRFNEKQLGVYGEAGGIFERNNIYNCVDGARVWGAATTFRGNWIHDLIWMSSSWTPQPEGTHNDVIQFAPAAYTGQMTVLGNWLDANMPEKGSGDNPSCIMLPQQITNLLIEKNWIDWGCWPMNFGPYTPNAGSVFVVKDNIISPGWKVVSGTTAHAIAGSAIRAMWQLTGNTDRDTGGPIRVHSA